MRDLHIFNTSEELYHAAADLLVQAGVEAIQKKDRFNIVLSGGSTPLPLYHNLAEKKFAQSLDWSKTHFFWGDERPVGPDHPDSNFRGAYHALLFPLKIPARNYHRIQGELPPQEAAEEYEQELQKWFGSELPRFDLVLLGIGDDGHTASLFPNTDLVHQDLTGSAGWVKEVYVPQLSTWRVSMTADLINTASLVIFLALGRDKSNILKDVLQGPQQPEFYPAQLIHPEQGRLMWLIDQDAASKLEI